MDPRGTILLSTALRIVGAIAISVEEAVAMGVVIGVAGVGINIVYSQQANRFKPKDTRSNQQQNKEFNRIADEYNLDSAQKDRLHRKITKRGYSREEIIKWIEKLFPQNIH